MNTSPTGFHGDFASTASSSAFFSARAPALSMLITMAGADLEDQTSRGSSGPEPNIRLHSSSVNSSVEA